ncbi:DNA photolyase phr1, partial [Cymbomonas tetramitiformis]
MNFSISSHRTAPALPRKRSGRVLYASEGDGMTTRNHELPRKKPMDTTSLRLDLKIHRISTQNPHKFTSASSLLGSSCARFSKGTVVFGAWHGVIFKRFATKAISITAALPEAMAPLVDESRVRELQGGKVKPGAVVYWCSRDQRVNDNWALLYAAEKAQESGSPLAVVFNLVPKFLGAGARQFGFMLRGIREMAAELEQRGIKFALLEGDPVETLPKFVEASKATLLVTDMSPLRLGLQWREGVANAISIPFHEVDAHNVVPVWEASDKKEVGARTLRGRLAKHYPQYL